MIGHISANTHRSPQSDLFRLHFLKRKLRSSSMGSGSKTAAAESLLPSEKTLAWNKAESHTVSHTVHHSPDWKADNVRENTKTYKNYQRWKSWRCDMSATTLLAWASFPRLLRRCGGGSLVYDCKLRSALKWMTSMPLPCGCHSASYINITMSEWTPNLTADTRVGKCPISTSPNYWDIISDKDLKVMVKNPKQNIYQP